MQCWSRGLFGAGLAAAPSGVIDAADAPL